MDSPSPDHLATTIGAFNNLMQTTMPLFDPTLAMTDAELKNIARNSAVRAMVRTVPFVGIMGSLGLAAAGIVAGPIGIIAATATVAATAVTAAASTAGVALNKVQNRIAANEAAASELGRQNNRKPQLIFHSIYCLL